LFGDKLAVLVGDLLYAQVFALLTSLTELGANAQLALFELFVRTTRKMCLGEIYEDRIVADPPSVSYQDYLNVIDYKTASLMACCCRASAIAVGADEQDSALAEEFGMHLGRSYQLMDDVVDEDSVYFNRERMTDHAIDEGSRSQSVLERIGDNDGTRRLAEITHAITGRAAERARLA
jgi:geranylgeranyl pyrophosphate synthase